MLTLLGCTGARLVPTRDGKPVGFLRFEVQPTTAEVKIDEQYSGAIEKWTGGAIPVEPGLRRVTLMADGYISQRLDVEVAVGEEVTIVLSLEPVLELEKPPPHTSVPPPPLP